MEKWNVRKLPDFKKGLQKILNESSEFSKHYMRTLKSCENQHSREDCISGNIKGRDSDHFSYVRDDFNKEKYDFIKDKIETVVDTNHSIYRAISTCNFDELVHDLKKYGKTKQFIAEGEMGKFWGGKDFKKEQKREQWGDLGRYWSWNDKGAYAYWGESKCFGGKQKYPTTAILKGKLLYPTAINVNETFSSNMLFGSDESELTLTPGSIIHVEEICEYEDKYKGQKAENPKKCVLIDEKMRV